jgi:hypothetical protein
MMGVGSALGGNQVGDGLGADVGVERGTADGEGVRVTVGGPRVAVASAA